MTAVSVDLEVPQDRVLDEFLRATRRDLSEADLTAREARYLVDTYYLWQKQRQRAANQVLAASKDGEPARAVQIVIAIGYGIEEAIKRSLARYSRQDVVGRWAEAQIGIGPVLSAGLLCHIDMQRAPTVGHIYAFGGWAPGHKEWVKGERRPFSVAFRTLLWKIGDSFVKQSGRDACVYGRVYRDAKERIVAKDAADGYEETAARTLSEVPKHRQAAIYKTGHLPAGRLDLMARRIAVKLFLCHWHQVAHWTTFGRLGPRPFVIEHLGHTDVVPIPQASLVPGLVEAMAADGREREVV